MKWVHPAWKTLGIEPTSDSRAIRVAYSAKLKAIDPDRDPQAFIELREAFEAAKIQAQWVDLPDEDEDEEEFDEAAWEDEAWAPSGDLYQIRPSFEPLPPEAPDPAWQAPETPAPAAPASPWAPITPADADAHARALATLLYSSDSEKQRWPTPEQEEEMLAHWRAIAGDPRMQEVAYFADAERWFSELIARTAAFSDPLVTPATEYFGWLRSDGTIAQTHAVAYVTRRYRMLEFQQALKQPKHPLNPAWRELLRPAGERHRRGAVSGRKVRQLLRIVRTNYPDLEGCFDTYRVALWDDTHGGRGGSGWGSIGWGIAFVLFVLIFVASFGDRGGKSPPTPVAFESELKATTPDIDIALQTLFGDKLDIATVAAKNPALDQALRVFWTEQRERYATRASFAANLESYLGRWYGNGVRKGSAALLADHHALVIDMARRLRTTDPAACQRFLTANRRWQPSLNLPAELREREKAVQIRALLETDGTPPPQSGRTRFSIPGEVVVAARHRTGVSEKAMQQALLFEGPPAQQCAPRIAFMETVLAMRPGRQRTEIMREM